MPERPTAFAAERFSEDLRDLNQDDLSSNGDELAHALAARVRANPMDDLNFPRQWCGGRICMQYKHGAHSC